MDYKIIKYTGYALTLFWSIALIYDVMHMNVSHVILDIAMMLMAIYTAKD